MNWPQITQLVKARPLWPVGSVPVTVMALPRPGENLPRPSIWPAPWRAGADVRSGSRCVSAQGASETAGWEGPPVPGAFRRGRCYFQKCDTASPQGRLSHSPHHS